MRAHILKTLLRKEVLRFRYNWGLLVMVGGVLALAGLLSISARLGQLSEEGTGQLDQCLVLVPRNSEPGQQWVDYLNRNVPPRAERANLGVNDFAWAYEDKYRQPSGRYKIPMRTVGMLLQPPPSGKKEGVWRVRYYIPEGAEREAMGYRHWFITRTHTFLGRSKVAEDFEEVALAVRALDVTDRVPLFVTGLVIFAFYLLSFNLFITTTGEERDKKALLALMLTPATPGEVLGAKVIFYSTASLLVAMLVVAMYKPLLLLNPRLWLVVLLGSICYIAIGTVILCIVKKQTTLNTVSMLYLIVTALIMFMSVFLIPFFILKHALIENYVFRQLVATIAQKPSHLWPIDFAAMCVVTTIWVAVAVRMFRRHGMKLAHVQR